MKSFIRILIVIIILLGVASLWLVFGTGTAFSEKSKYFLIREDAKDKNAVLETLAENNIVKYPFALDMLINLSGGWNHLKSGKYEVKKGQTIWSIARQIKNGRVAEMKLVINRIRIKEDLAKLISKNFSPDSSAVMQYLKSNDSLAKWHVDSNTVFTIIIPDTYSFYWNVSLDKIFQKLYDANNLFWSKNDRSTKLQAIHFSKEDAYTLASIVDEETNYDSDKYKIASVYINRLQKQMPLQACPTIKYAMKDFTLTRIYEKYLSNPSLYNTYRHKGLPPGPICTPSPKTIDIVLNAPKTDYLFFVAKSDFSGYHHFSSNFAEHNSYAKEYQKALDIYMAEKQAAKH
ncbi:MAG: endolytic transglycosylase MltG [Chitinophagaceae bacterium]|nr:endolytic transglycosylase MltG [Chitinophagaceae bacterium]